MSSVTGSAPVTGAVTPGMAEMSITAGLSPPGVVLVSQPVIAISIPAAIMTASPINFLILIFLPSFLC
jgi:hypothetical protein